MRRLTVGVNPPYDIVIGQSLIKETGRLAAGVMRGSRALVISDSNVAPLYSDAVTGSLEQAGIETHLHVFPAGEAHKNIQTVWDMLEAAAESGLTRTDTVIALGGGVTGDLAGMAAAIYLRGVDYIQIPTTVLSQSDSSVGGKTGCDLTCGKNLAGAFKQPRLVIIDTDVLATLPSRYRADGMAEIIKYGCISSPELFDIIENGGGDIEDILYRSVDIKRTFVEKDEFDTSERMKLNFGHTMGHAIEKYYSFTGPSHGEAVAAGMVIAARAGEAAKLTKPGTADRLVRVLKAAGLPTETNVPLSELVRIAALDKKRMGDNINLILISEIGSSFIHKIPAAELHAFLEGGLA